MEYDTTLKSRATSKEDDAAADDDDDDDDDDDAVDDFFQDHDKTGRQQGQIRRRTTDKCS